MQVFVFGNEDLPQDSLPLRLLPSLRQQFTDFDFVTVDPNEEWEVLEDLIVLDTACGITQVQVFDDLEAFAPAPRLTMHDFDALSNLRYLKKLGKLKKIKIIGVPMMISEEEAIKQIAKILIAS